jgi:hypothetical protein
LDATQKSQIENLKSENEQLKNEIAEIRSVLGLQNQSSETREQPKVTNSIESATGLLINPNPAKEMVTVQFSNEAHLNIQIIITDATGRKVKVVSTNENKVEIPTVQLPNGSYQLMLLNGSKMIASEKLIISK